MNVEEFKRLTTTDKSGRIVFRNGMDKDSVNIPDGVYKVRKDVQEYTMLINPHTKPRMVASDAYKKRPCVIQYWEYKDALKNEAKRVGLHDLPGHIVSIKFIVEMPDSWSKRKKLSMDGKPHEQVPDIDNCLKGIFDALCKQDKHIWNISNGLLKVWGFKGMIIIKC